MKRSSSPLVSSVPATSTTGSPAAASGRDLGARGSQRSRAAAALRRAGARRRLDLRRRHRLRPARRQHRVRDVDARSAHARGRRAPRVRGRRRRRRPPSASIVLVAVPADAEQALLQRRGRRRAAPDSMTRLIRPLTMMATRLGDRGGDADVLLDDEHGDLALLAEPHQHLLDLRDDHRREALGRLVHDEEPRVERAARARSRASAARRRRAARRRCSCARRGAGRCRRCARPSTRRAAAARRHAQMLVDGERAPQPPALRHVADAEPRDLRRREPASAPRRRSGSSRSTPAPGP